MSVSSKALRLAVLFALGSGCTASTPSPQLGLGAREDSTNSPATASSQLTPSGEVEQGDALKIASEVVVSRELAGLEVKKEGNSFLINSGITAPEYRSFLVSEPARLIVDITGVTAVAPGVFPVTNNSSVKSVRVGRRENGARIVFDLANAQDQSTKPNITEAGSAIAVAFGDAEIPAQVAAAPEAETNIAASNNGAATEAVVLDALTFLKSASSSGTITAALSGRADFELKQTSPTEYTLTLKNAKSSEQATLPQIAPVSFPGIRTARAVQKGDDVLVRMFVDSGVDMKAERQGHNVIVHAKALGAAHDPEARGQLEPEKDAKPAEGKTEEAAKEEGSAENAGAQVTEIDDDTARRNPTGVPSADGSKIYTGRLISLDLQETDIDNALRIIAEVSNLNIIASDDVTGKVTLRLIDVPWDQALDVILKTNGLDQVTEGNVIRIAPVDKLRQEREALREAKKAAENLEDLHVKYLRISYARATDLKEQVEAVLSERGSVTVDERTNQIIVKDINKGQGETLELVKKLDLRTPQVLLETQIVEASRNILRDLGFQWNFSYSQSAATGNATGLNFPNSVVVGGGTTSSNGQQQAINFPAVLGIDSGSAVSAVLDSADGSRALAMRLSALEEEGKVKVVSRPQVATVNNKQAEIKSVETVRVRLPDSGLAVATGQGAAAQGGGASAFEEIDVGITLKVTPQASPDYYVLLDVYTKSSTFGSQRVDNIPSTLEREATSTILVKSGQTFALGGVYRINDTDRIQGVPFLKDIPVLGNLFRRTLTDKRDEELIFFITPHIVEGSFDPSLM